MTVLSLAPVGRKHRSRYHADFPPGLYGIAAASTYISLHPKHRLVILESSSCLGGVWSSERVYDAFWTQTPVNMATYSDRPIKTPPREETYFDYFPAHHVSRYLSEYVDQPKDGGYTIRQKILFNTQVDRVDFSAATGQWKMQCAGEKASVFSSPKLLVAAGLTSRPSMPHLPEQAVFQGTIIHHAEFGQSSILQDPTIKHVAVFGGAKSAADVAYAAAKAGKVVSWMIRRSGSGPAHMASVKGRGPYQNSNEMLYTRLTASLSPSIWNGGHWLSRLWHETRVGRWLVDKIWAATEADLRREANYSGRGGKRGWENGFANLEPDMPLFWQNDSTGVNQRPDFWETIATKVHVYRQDVNRLKEHGVVLEEDEVEQVDAIVCATGWRPSYGSFFDHDLALDLGLSVRCESAATDGNEAKQEAGDDQAADAEIMRLFPRLRHPPPAHRTGTKLSTPFRLYRHMIPTKASSYSGIVFLGHIAVGNNFRASEVQALWALAYLDGRMERPPPSRAEMENQVALTVAWCRRRYLSKGEQGHWLYYDLVPYTDRLLEDIGLGSHRRKGRWGNWWKPCVASDMEGLLEELKAKREGCRG